MRKIIFLLSAIIIAATAIAQNPISVPGKSNNAGVPTTAKEKNKKNNTSTSKPSSKGNVSRSKNGGSKNTPVTQKRGEFMGHSYVDLGLPSGIKWATVNIGASQPSDAGYYFAWGETSPKSNYTEQTCKTQDMKMTDISGNPQYDAATAQWGGSWRMPTLSEFEELAKNCKVEWKTVNGVKCMRLVGPNGNSILFPCAGYKGGTEVSVFGKYGGYYTSTPHKSDVKRTAGCGFWSDDSLNIGHPWDRGDGRPVRAVSY